MSSFVLEKWRHRSSIGIWWDNVDGLRRVSIIWECEIWIRHGGWGRVLSCNATKMNYLPPSCIVIRDGLLLGSEHWFGTEQLFITTQFLVSIPLTLRYHIGMYLFSPYFLDSTKLNNIYMFLVLVFRINNRKIIFISPRIYKGSTYAP